MARPSRSRPLLCIDVAADTLHATFLPKGQQEPRLSGLLPATATPVALPDGEIGFRVGDVAFARRLVDAERTINALPGYFLRQAADSMEAVAEGSMPFVDEAVLAHESLTLPMAHLLAHATRRALGEQEPTLDAAAAADETPEMTAHVQDEDEGSDEADDARDEDSEEDKFEAEVASAQKAADAVLEEAQADADPAQSPTARALEHAEALLLVGPHVGASAQDALSEASAIAGLPAPSFLLRDEALAHAAWHLARAQVHAERVREQMARQAHLETSASLLQAADNEPPRTRHDEAATFDEHEDAAGSENEPTALEAAFPPLPGGEDSADAVATAPEEDARPEASDEAEPQEQDAIQAPEPAPPSAVIDPPRAWLQVAVGADGFSVCQVEVGEQGPRVRKRAHTSHASLSAVETRAFAWACEAWDATSDAPPLDALAERRLIDAAAKAFRSLATQQEGDEVPQKTSLSLPALALREGDQQDEAISLLGLDLTLSRKEALSMLEPLTALALGTIDDLVPRREAPQKKAPKKSRRKKQEAPQAPDAPGIVVTGDLQAWPGLIEALLDRLPAHRLMSSPSCEAIAHAARALLDGIDAVAA